MARFVHDAEEGFGKEVCVIPRGQAGVARSNAAAKWVSGDVQTPVVKVEADLRGDRCSKFFLLVYGICAREDIFVGLFAGFGDCAHEFDEFVAQAREDPSQVFSGFAGFIVV